MEVLVCLVVQYAVWREIEMELCNCYKFHKVMCRFVMIVDIGRYICSK